MAERESLCECVRQIATSIVDTSTQEGKILLRAAAVIEVTAPSLVDWLADQIADAAINGRADSPAGAWLRPLSSVREDGVSIVEVAPSRREFYVTKGDERVRVRIERAER